MFFWMMQKPEYDKKDKGISNFQLMFFLADPVTGWVVVNALRQRNKKADQVSARISCQLSEI